MDRFDIFEGPDKERVINNFSQASLSGDGIKFKIQKANNLSEKKDATVNFSKLEKENIAGVSWFFKGNILKLNNLYNFKECKGYYNSETRKGWIEF